MLSNDGSIVDGEKYWLVWYVWKCPNCRSEEKTSGRFVSKRCKLCLTFMDRVKKIS